MVIHVNFSETKNPFDYEPIRELNAVYTELVEQMIDPCEIKVKVKEKGKAVAIYTLIDILEDFDCDNYFVCHKEAGEALFEKMVRPKSLETKEEFIAAFEEWVELALKKGWL